MTIHPFINTGLLLLITSAVVFIRKRPQNFLARYWAILLSSFGLLIIILAVSGIIQNNGEINRYIAEYHSEPDNYGGLVFLAMAAFGLLITLMTSPFTYKQIKHRKKHI